MFLDQQELPYTEYKIDGDSGARSAMIDRADGRSTVPQVFINDHGIGGCDELLYLDRSGQLDAILGR